MAGPVVLTPLGQPRDVGNRSQVPATRPVPHVGRAAHVGYANLGEQGAARKRGLGAEPALFHARPCAAHPGHCRGGAGGAPRFRQPESVTFNLCFLRCVPFPAAQPCPRLAISSKELNDT